MENVITIISLSLGFLGSSGAFISWILYRKQEKRNKNADAVEKEIASLRVTIKTLEENQTWYDTRLEAMQKWLISKDSYIEVILKDKDLLEIKHAKNKGAINKAYSCKFCPQPDLCPVIIVREKNEEEYIKALEKQKLNDDKNNSSEKRS